VSLGIEFPVKQGILQGHLGIEAPPIIIFHKPNSERFLIALAVDQKDVAW